MDSAHRVFGRILQAGMADRLMLLSDSELFALWGQLKSSGYGDLAYKLHKLDSIAGFSPQDMARINAAITALGIELPQGVVSSVVQREEVPHSSMDAKLIPFDYEVEGESLPIPEKEERPIVSPIIGLKLDRPDYEIEPDRLATTRDERPAGLSPLIGVRLDRPDYEIEPDGPAAPRDMSSYEVAPSPLMGLRLEKTPLPSVTDAGLDEPDIEPEIETAIEKEIEQAISMEGLSVDGERFMPPAPWDDEFELALASDNENEILQVMASINSAYAHRATDPGEFTSAMRERDLAYLERVASSDVSEGLKKEALAMRDALVSAQSILGSWYADYIPSLSFAAINGMPPEVDAVKEAVSQYAMLGMRVGSNDEFYDVTGLSPDDVVIVDVSGKPWSHDSYGRLTVREALDIHGIPRNVYRYFDDVSLAYY